MYCNTCGQALVAGQGFCPRCGRASGMGMPMTSGVGVPGASGGPGFWPSLEVVERRVNALAMGWYAYAILVGVTGFIGLAIAHAWMGAHMGNFGGWPGHLGRRFFDGPAMPLIFLRFAWLALSIRFGLALAAGYGLMHKTTWGRTVAIIAGFLSLLHPILGTALGIWTLVVLLKAPNAAGYEAMAR